MVNYNSYEDCDTTVPISIKEEYNEYLELEYAKYFSHSDIMNNFEKEMDEIAEKYLSPDPVVKGMTLDAFPKALNVILAEFDNDNTESNFTFIEEDTYATKLNDYIYILATVFSLEIEPLK